MESQMHHPHGRNYDEEPPHNSGLNLHAVMEGEGGQHHEKKSVMKKVKDKAKKIKETLTKHGHGHDLHDEEDDEGEETVQDPEVHGAPIYESAAVRSGITGRDENLGQAMGNLERPSAMAGSEFTDTPVRPFSQRQDENLGLGVRHADAVVDGKNESPAAGAYGTEVSDPTINMDRGQERNPDHLRGEIGVVTGTVEDPNRPGAVSPSNYETKVPDPKGAAAGGEEVEIKTILSSFDKMGINHQSEPKSKPEQEQKLYAGTHDQFSPELVPKSCHPNTPEDLPRDNLTGKPSNQGYISAATSAITNKAAAAKDVVASTLGYGGNDSTGSQETTKSEQGSNVPPTETERVTQKLAPVYKKVADAGSSVMSIVQGTGTGQQGVEKAPDEGVSAKGYLVEKFRPGDEDKALAEVITHAFHKGKEETEKTGEKAPNEDRRMSHVITDAFLKRNEEPENKSEERPVGKVTESEEVARRLGTEKGVAAGNGSTEKGVADWLKGTVSSWLGKGGESQTSQGLTTTASGENENVRNAGERRLQESSN